MNKIILKKGISLIVLVITIIVLIILAMTIILSLDGSNIIGRTKGAKKSSDIANAKELVALAKSEWSFERPEGYNTFREYAEAKLMEAGYKTEGNGGIRVSEKGSVNTIFVDSNGVEVIIPEGFVVSEVASENTVENGLVIYDGYDTVTDKNINDAQKTRNQFVWIPVEYNNANIYIDVNNNGLDDDFDSIFVRNNEYRGEIYSLFTEPCSTIQSLSILNDTTKEWQEELELRKSVAFYGGFYLGRYEAGTLYERTENTNNGTMGVLIQKDKFVYNHVGWSPSMIEANGDVIYLGYNQGKGAVELSRKLYNTNSVKSHLIYGVEWDAIMKYISSDVDVIDSSAWGNFKNYNDSVNEKNRVEEAGEICNTGYSEYWKVKNIYDLAGNMYEWTMEAKEEHLRIARGGHQNSSGTSGASKWNPGTPKFTVFSYGFRPALYLK